MAYIFEESDVRIVLTNTQIQCQKCKEWKDAEEVGLRQMTPHGEIRNQSYCKECR